MKYLSFPVGFLVLALVTTKARSDGYCRNVHRCAAPVRVVERVVVDKVAVVDAVAVVPVVSAFLPAVVQAYGAAYVGGQPFGQQVVGQPGYGSQPGAAPGYAGTGQSDAVLTAIQQLGQRLGAMEQRMGINPPAAQTPMPPADAPRQTQIDPPWTTPQQVDQSSGVLSNLSAEKQREVLRRVYSTDAKVSMPRNGRALTDEELSLVVGWVAGSGPPAPEVTRLFQTRCASCHQSGREGAGGGFVLTLR